MTKTLDLTKLIELCTLFSSTEEDEVIAAVHQANALVKASGYTWNEILGIPEDGSVLDSEMLETIDNYLEYAFWLDKNLVAFLKTTRKLVAFGFELNDRQRDWLEHIRKEVAIIVAIQTENTKG